MPKRTQEQYESDGGFVDDAPKGKKAKATNNKAATNTEQQVDDDGNTYWELSSKRRLGISTFKNATMVNIREYYEKDGKDLPGKKGISLSIDQYTTLLNLLPQIETVLKSKGEKVPRPEYGGSRAMVKSKQEASDADQDDDEAVDAKRATGSKLEKYKMKANHEATSDEDDE